MDAKHEPETTEENVFPAQLWHKYYHENIGLKVALEDGEILRELLDNLKIGIPAQDSPEQQILSTWNRWQTKVTEHLLPQHQRVFLHLRSHLPQPPLTLKGMRHHLVKCLDRQIGYIRSLLAE